MNCYYEHLKAIVSRTFSGETRREIDDIMATKIALENGIIGYRLKKYYPEEGARVVKRLPNRTATNCTSKASELKIRSTGAKKEYARWTKEDNEILRKYYPIEGEACFTRFPYRTYRACQAHARKIGLAKPHMLPWTEEEERILRENYPVMRTRITELLPHRSKAACTLRASQKKISSRNKSKREYSDEDE